MAKTATPAKTFNPDANLVDQMRVIHEDHPFIFDAESATGVAALYAAAEVEHQFLFNYERGATVAEHLVLLDATIETLQRYRAVVAGASQLSVMRDQLLRGQKKGGPKENGEWRFVPSAPQPPKRRSK